MAKLRRAALGLQDGRETAVLLKEASGISRINCKDTYATHMSEVGPMLQALLSSASQEGFSAPPTDGV